MDHLIYTAASGASRTMQAQAVKANNLSNANTTGFRADMNIARQSAVGGDSFDGRTLVYSNTSKTKFTQGALIETGRSLDAAINGSGFFAIEGAGGAEVYPRAGNFELDNEGALLLNGRPVIGEGGPIVIPENRAIAINGQGQILVTPPQGLGEIEAGRLKIVNPNPNNLYKDEQGFIRQRNGAVAPADETVQIAPGFLEGSNVSAIEELVGIMSLSRNFEMQIKVMKSAETLAEAGNRLLRS